MNDYKFKTDPFRHQEERFYKYRDKLVHAHLWEQRCGKSKISLDQAAYLNMKGRISGLLILAPCGVHLNWVRNEIPIHMPDYVGCDPVVWKSDPNAEERRSLERLTKTTGFGMKALSMNLESLRTERGFEFARDFMMNYRTMMIVDEGSSIKNPAAIQTKKVLELAPLAPYRRLLNGTPVTQSPLDVFPQFAFLDWGIFGSSYVAFRNKYAIVEMQGRMKGEVKKVLENVAATQGTYPWGELQYSEMKGVVEAGIQPVADGPPIEFYVKQKRKTFYELRWRCGTVTGSKGMMFQSGDTYSVITGFRNLDEMKLRIEPHSDRVLKADCLDLPDKIYSKRYVELSKAQLQMYRELKRECVTQCAGREMTAALAITKLLRLQQIVGGFFVPDNINMGFPEADDWSQEEIENCSVTMLDGGAVAIPGPNPRLDALMDDIENGMGGKGIVWARFKAEIIMIARALREKYGPGSVAELYGDVKAETRQKAIALFQQDEWQMDGMRKIYAPNPLRFLVANPACKGVSRGQNFCAAEWEWYYSNSFSLEDRLQSEDRAHSPGQNNNLSVVDAVASGTMDEKVIDTLRGKKNLADMVTGDKLVEWI